MSKHSVPARLIVLAGAAAVLGTSLLPVAAIAKDKDEHTITVPASAIKDATSKLCMPRRMMDKSKKWPLPKTVCYQQAECAETGTTMLATYGIHTTGSPTTPTLTPELHLT